MIVYRDSPMRFFRRFWQRSSHWIPEPGGGGGEGGVVGCSAFMPSVYRQGFEVKLGIALKGIMRTYKEIFLSSEREILCQIPLEKKIDP